MEDSHGGKREGAGRKPKVSELKLIEQMDAILVPESLWIKVAELIEEKDIQAIKLWVQYRFGMPKQIIDNNLTLKSGFPTLKQFYGEQEVEKSDE